MEDLKKCEKCGVPLNKEITSQRNPNLCFECAEEKRQFTPEVEESRKRVQTEGSKKAWWKFW